MKWERLTSTILICALVIGGTLLISSCGKKPAASTTTKATKVTTTTTTATVTPTETTISVPTFSGPLPTNTTAKTPKWTETKFDPAKTLYVKLKDGLLKVRTGPGTDYDQVAALTNGMAVTVVAKTDTNWYKLDDGYYISADFVTSTKP